MIRLMLLPACWILLCELAQAREQQFPYVAYVTDGQAYVRSGPGQKYYPTQQLPEGFAVEVYRHDADGWCAVRPPEGSFSWISARQVRIESQTVAEIAAEGVVTRIGSSLSPARSAVQVLLPRGERVELLANGPHDNPDWLRIAAPAGEFRWVAANQLSLQPPMETALPETTAVAKGKSSSGWSSQSPHKGASEINQVEPNTVFNHLQNTNGSGPGSNAFTPPVVSSAPAADYSIGGNAAISQDPNAIQVVAGSPAELQLVQYQQQASTGELVSPDLLGQGVPTNPATPSSIDPNRVGVPTSSNLYSSAPRVRFRGLSETDGEIAQRLGELQLRLSQTVVQPPEQWSFEQLESEAAVLLEKSESPRVRSQLRDLLDRVSRFQRVRLGYQAGTMPADSSLAQSDLTERQDEEGLTGLTSKVRDLAKADLAASDSDNSDIAAASSVDKPLYDAVGLLKPVTSKRAKAPQYALVDDKGSVVSFVTPTPDLNLKPYLGRRIGVHGTRGFMQEYRRAHVTAERISPISDQIRR